MKKIYIFLTLVLFALNAFAQAPSAFNYQAVLRDASGNIRTNANVNIRIDLLQTSATGTAVYSESFATTTNAYGLVNLQVGKGTVISGTFANINWGNALYFIKVSVDGTELGTSQLLAVPYAKYAEKAGNGFSGSYTDLSNKPTLFSGSYTDLTSKPTFSTVATSGSYNDLTNRPTFTETDPIFALSVAKAIKAADTTRWGKKSNFSGNYNDLTNKPTMLDANYNTATGFKALSLNTTGDQNTATGYQSLYSNTTGAYNTSYGYESLYSNTKGNHNTACGNYSLHYNIDGEANTAIGQFSLYKNTAGHNNTAIGSCALFSNTTGKDNTANGLDALNNNTTGNNNVAVGMSALYKNQITHNNTAIGTYALESNISKDNTAVGYQALYANTDGFENVAVGVLSLSANTTGNANTAIGKSAMTSLVSGTLNTAIGCYSDIANNVSNSTAIGNGAKADVSDKVRIGNDHIKVIEGQVAFTSASDARLKKNIKDITSGTDFIMKLRPVEYQMKQGDEKINFGFIAQDIEKLLGTNNSLLTIGGDADRTLGLRYTDLIAPLVKTVQEQQKQIESQQKQINELKQLVEKLLSK